MKKIVIFCSIFSTVCFASDFNDLRAKVKLIAAKQQKLALESTRFLETGFAERDFEQTLEKLMREHPDYSQSELAALIAQFSM